MCKHNIRSLHNLCGSLHIERPLKATLAKLDEEIRLFTHLLSSSVLRSSNNVPRPQFTYFMRRFIADRRWRTRAEMKGVSWSCRPYLDVRWLGLMGAGRLLLTSWRSLMQVRASGSCGCRRQFRDAERWVMSSSIFMRYSGAWHHLGLPGDHGEGGPAEGRGGSRCQLSVCASVCLSALLRPAKSVGGARRGGRWCRGSLRAQKEGSQRLKW